MRTQRTCGHQEEPPVQPTLKQIRNAESFGWIYIGGEDYEFAKEFESGRVEVGHYTRFGFVKG